MLFCGCDNHIKNTHGVRERMVTLMQNGILLNALFAEFYAECAEKTMHIDDLQALDKVKVLIERELPKADGKESQDD